jgi:hypothetical protein
VLSSAVVASLCVGGLVPSGRASPQLSCTGRLLGRRKEVPSQGRWAPRFALKGAISAKYEVRSFVRVCLHRSPAQSGAGYRPIYKYGLTS